jgi:hypothetical protein
VFLKVRPESLRSRWPEAIARSAPSAFGVVLRTACLRRFFISSLADPSPSSFYTPPLFLYTLPLFSFFLSLPPLLFIPFPSSLFFLHPFPFSLFLSPVLFPSYSSRSPSLLHSFSCYSQKTQVSCSL